MKTKIESIGDLTAERARLKNQVTLSDIKLKNHFNILKEELQPARQVVEYAKNLLVNNGNRKSFVGIGLRFGVNAILKNTVLYRASWLTRLVVPFIANNVVANYVAKHDTEILENTINWVKEKTSNDPKMPKKPKVSLAEKALMWVKDVTEEKPKYTIEERHGEIRQLRA
jgi:hypothetical protein